MTDPSEFYLHNPAWDCSKLKKDKTKQVPEDSFLKQPILTGMEYDDCSYKKYIQETTGPGKWALSQRMNDHQSPHVQHPGFMNTNHSGIVPSNVDIESHLKNLGVYNSSCPDKKQNPFMGNTCNECKKSFTGLPCNSCSQQLRESDKEKPQHQFLSTRDRKECGNVADIYIDRFESSRHEVQTPSRIHSNEFIGVDSRSKMKQISLLKNKNLKSTIKDMKTNDIENCSINKKISSLNCLLNKDISKNFIIPK